MAKLDPVGITDEDLKSFPEIARHAGYYLNVLTGDIFRNSGEVTKGTQELIKKYHVEGPDPLDRRPFLLITTDLKLSQREVKYLASGKFHLHLLDLGKVVDSWD